MKKQKRYEQKPVNISPQKIEGLSALMNIQKAALMLAQKNAFQGKAKGQVAKKEPFSLPQICLRVI